MIWLRPLRILLAATALFVSGPGAAKDIPPPPPYYVLDQAHALSPRANQALQALLIEHDRATDEQFVVAIFDRLDGEDPNAYANQVFQAWKIGQQGHDNGVLLAVFYQDHQARIEVGYGLEAVLTDAKSSEVLHEILVPQMKAGHPDEAITLASYRILEILNSPLMQGGRAEQILRSSGVQRTRIGPSRPESNLWWIWLFLGGVLMTVVFHLLTSAEAHFTAGGWYRPRPWKRGHWNEGDTRSSMAPGGGWGPGGGWRGNESSGGQSDGGGFLGGGGRSGGGGASAGW